MRRLLILLLCLPAFSVQAQYSLDGYIDIGANNVSSGVYVKPALISAYRYKFIKAQTGLMWTFPVTNGNGFAAWFINTKADFKIKKAKFEGGLFYRHIPFSKFAREHNWGLWLGFNSKHFTMKVGNNFHTYKITSKGMEEFGLTKDDDMKISEPRNLMYDFTYMVKPLDHPWNLMFGITDYDHFLIQQETNPMIRARFEHLVHGLRLYGELRYQTAGLLNLQVNYFGINLRTGVLWQL
jgi:hypothetical protein